MRTELFWIQSHNLFSDHVPVLNSTEFYAEDESAVRCDRSQRAASGTGNYLQSRAELEKQSLGAPQVGQFWISKQLPSRKTQRS